MKKCSFLTLLLALGLSSCAITHSSAPIEYNHSNSSSQHQKISEKTNAIIDDEEIISSTTPSRNEPQLIEPSIDEDDYAIPQERAPKQNEKIIYHEVGVGETIEEIAENYHQNVKEIADLNDLSPPYYLDESQVIKIKAVKNIEKKKVLVEDRPAPSQEKISDLPSAEFINPVEGKIIAKFGEKTKNGINKGINIAANKGQAIKATASGKVIYADFDATFGNLVIIKLLDKDMVTSYAHLDSIIVRKNAIINQGELVGYVGSTGKISQPQLHFGIREGKTAQDPSKYGIVY